MRIDAIPNTLSFMVSAIAQRQSVETDGQTYSLWYCPINYGVSFRKGAWGVAYQGSLPHKELDGTAIAKNYLSSNLQAYWQHRNVRLSLGCYWLGTQAEYRSESIPNRYFHEKTQTVIRNNRSMVVVGVSWNFNTGKKKEDITRKFNNSDTDSGLFE